MNAPKILDSPDAPLAVRSGDLFCIPREQLIILRHAIGYDDNGNDRYPNARSMDERRNRFVTDSASADGENCQHLVAQGWMADHGPQNGMGGMNYYTVTAEGENVVRMHKPLKAQLTASQRRYRDYLRADSGLRFGEWLKRRGMQNDKLSHGRE